MRKRPLRPNYREAVLKYYPDAECRKDPGGRSFTIFRGGREVATGATATAAWKWLYDALQADLSADARRTRIL